jgi:hypothetical protein
MRLRRGRNNDTPRIRSIAGGCLLFFFFDIPPVFPGRGLYARVSRVDSLSTSPHRRASFEFDCIDADYVDDVGPQLLDGFRAEQTKPFALLRVVTTPARFGDFAGTIPTPGDWFHLEIEPGGAGLPTWHAQLEADGYSTHARCHDLRTTARHTG